MDDAGTSFYISFLNSSPQIQALDLTVILLVNLWLLFSYRHNIANIKQEKRIPIKLLAKDILPELRPVITALPQKESFPQNKNQDI